MSTVILSAARTPIARFQGGLSGLAASELGAAALRAAIARAHVPSAAVEEVVLGNVLSAGQGQAPAKQAAIQAGLPRTVPTTLINKVCGSGLKAVMLADQAIRAGDAHLVVAGGMESMSNAPYLLQKARGGYRLGHHAALDSMIHDGLWDPFENVHMGQFGDRFAQREEIDRAAQDAYATESYRRAQRAQAEGWLSGEITPVGPCVEDEEPSRFRPDRIESLPPAFSADGTVTAGNASKINDGAAALVLADATFAARVERQPRATILSHATYSGEAGDFPIAPAFAIRAAAERAGLDLERIELFEISEAFSLVPLAVMRALALPHERVNVFGGAISLGHPLGASGARLLVTLLSAMELSEAELGCVSLCLGGGEAVALIVRRGDAS